MSPWSSTRRNKKQQEPKTDSVPLQELPLETTPQENKDVVNELKNKDIESPEAKANLLSILTYHWITPIFSLGWKRPLELVDLWKLPSKWSSKDLSQAFELEWQKELDRVQAANQPSVDNPKDSTQKKQETASLNKAIWSLMFWYALSSVWHNMAGHAHSIMDTQGDWHRRE
jgi:hypothetical protein